MSAAAAAAALGPGHGDLRRTLGAGAEMIRHTSARHPAQVGAGGADVPYKMSSKPALLKPLKRALSAFFKHDLTIKRDDAGVRLVLEDRLQPVQERPLTRAELGARKEERLLALAREQLAAVLDHDADARGRLRHLAHLEHALRKKGWRGLHKVPLEVLQRGLEQFEGLVSNWSPEGLAGLRSKMAVAVIERENDSADGEARVSQLDDSVLDAPEAVAAQAIESASRSSSDEDQALLAAYAALGSAAPSMVELHPELGPRAARGMPRSGGRLPSAADEIRLRDLRA